MKKTEVLFGKYLTDYWKVIIINADLDNQSRTSHTDIIFRSSLTVYFHFFFTSDLQIKYKYFDDNSREV